MSKLKFIVIACLSFLIIGSVHAGTGIILRDFLGEFTTYELDKDRVHPSTPTTPGNVHEDTYRPYWLGFARKTIDASIVYPKNNRIYIFAGKYYYRLDPDRRRTDSGYPKRMGIHGWRGVWKKNIDAALVSPDKKKIYFFKGRNYIRWDIATDRVDPGYPKRIGIDGWQGLWRSGIDAAIVHPTNKRAYFFKNGKYIRYTFGRGVDPGYPRNIGTQGWKGLYADITAAIVIDDKRVDFFHKIKNTAPIFNYPIGSKTQNTSDTRIHDYYIKLLNGAQTGSKVRIMVGGWDRVSLVQPIKNAIDRGVDVKIITNYQGGDHWSQVSTPVLNAIVSTNIQENICSWNNSISYIDGLGFNNINHAKFLIFSHVAGKHVYGKKLVVNGSSNWRYRDTERQNDALAVSDSLLYLNYSAYFQNIWDMTCDNKTLPTYTRLGKVLEQTNNIAGGFFPAIIDHPTPPDPVLNILNEIYCKDGKGKVRMAASTWHKSDRGLAVRDTLVRLKAEGCDVRVAAEGYKNGSKQQPAETTRSYFTDLRRAKIPFAKTKTHSKYLIAESHKNGIAKYYVITGSLNFSSGIKNGGSNGNPMLDTTITIKNNKELYQRYLKHWYWLWRTAFEKYESKIGRI